MPVADYSATVDGVRALLPDVVIDEDSKPSEEQVGEWVLDYTATVAGRIGSLDAITDEDVVADVERRARNLVHLAAGAQTEDAVHPSGASTTESSYGEVLWERYKEGLEQLATDVAVIIGQSSSSPNRDRPRGVYPPTSFPDRVRW